MSLFRTLNKQRSGSMLDVVYRILLAIAFILLLGFWTHVEANTETDHYHTYVAKVCKVGCVDPELLRMALYKASHESKLDPALLFALVQVESGFRDKSIDPTTKKSVGLAQIQVYWHKKKFLTNNYYDVFDNSRVGGVVLAECFQRHRGNRLKALWCYNGHQKHGIQRYALKVEKLYQYIRKQQFFV